MWLATASSDPKGMAVAADTAADMDSAAEPAEIVACIAAVAAAAAAEPMDFVQSRMPVALDSGPKDSTVRKFAIVPVEGKDSLAVSKACWVLDLEKDSSNR